MGRTQRRQGLSAVEHVVIGYVLGYSNEEIRSYCFMPGLPSVLGFAAGCILLGFALGAWL